jgi:sugar lactone lactonase YvrE
MTPLLSAVILLLFGARAGATAPPAVQYLGIPSQVFTSGISFPIGMAEDASGNVYIAEYSGNAVYKETLQANGTYVRSTVAHGFSAGPVGLAIDSAGNVYVGIDDNSANSGLLKETLQGDGSYVQSYIGPVLGDVYGIVIDSNGNIIATNNNEAENVYKFIRSGNTYTPSVIFTSPGGILAGMAMDATGNLFVAKEYTNTIYKLAPVGTPTTTTTYTSTSFTVGTGTSAFDLGPDSNGDLFIADNGGKIRLEVPNGSGSYTETILASGLSSSYGLTVGPTGTIYFGVSGAVDEFSPAAVNMGSPNLNVVTSAFTLNYTIQPGTVIGAINVVSQGVVNTQSGLPEFVNAGGGTCAVQTYSALTVCSVKVTFTPQFTGLQTGAVEILDTGGNVLNNVFLYGIGKAPIAGFSAGTAGLLSITGLGSTPLSGARHPVMDVAGNLYIADSGNNRIVKVAPGGAAVVVSTPDVTLDNPTAVAIDGAGNLYIADSGNGRVVELSAQGVASVLDTNSLALAANYGIAVDGQGNVYTSDASNNRVLEFPNLGSAHVLSTTSVTLGSVYGVAADGSGNIYIADESNARIVKVSNGTGTVLSTGALSPALADPTDVAVDLPGNVYITDTGNNRIVEVSSGSTSAFALGTGSYTLNDPICATVGNVEDLYICDSANGRIVTSNQESPAALTFTAPNTTQSIALLNLGNLSLTLSVPTTGQNPSFGTTNFTLPNAGNAGYCPQLSTTSAVANILSGANCSLSVEFSPPEATIGVLTDSLTITDNNLRVTASTQAIALSGTTMLTPTVTLTPSPASPIAYGQAQTSLGTTVSYTSGTPSGTVTFSDNNNSLGASVTLNAGSGSLAAQYYLPGSHTFEASYSGDSAFASATSAVATYVVNQASATVSGPASTVQVIHGTSGSIAATVAGQYSGAGISAPSGSVSYSIADSGSNIVASGSAAMTSGAATVPVANTMASGLYTVALSYSGDTNYNAAASTTALLHIGSITPTIAWAQPAQIIYATTLSGILNASASSNSTPVAGSFTYTATPGGGSAAAVSAATVLDAGNYLLTATFNPTDTTTYASASATVSLTVGKATPILFWSTPAAIVYGAQLGSALDAFATFGSSSVAGSFTYTATPTGGSATTVTAAKQLSAGSYMLTATFAPANTSEYASGAICSVSLTVNPATPSVTLASSVNPVLLTNPTILTAGVTAGAGAPTGSVGFFDGTTLVGSVSLSNGVAALTLSSLAVGSHSISAVYSGDSNFSATGSASLNETVIDFTTTAGGGGSGGGSGTGSGGGSGSSVSAPTQTVAPGSAATYTLSIAPTAGTKLPAPTVFTISGMPPGASAQVSPATWAPTASTVWTYPANTDLQNIALTIQLPSVTALNKEVITFGRGASPLLLGLLLLPYAGKMRRTSRRLGGWISMLIVIAAGCSLVIGISGCGSTNGFFAQPSHTYTITETVTSGALSHSATITLTVE